MASELSKFCGQLDRSIVFGDGKNLYVLINQGSGINSVAKLSTCDGLNDECESRLAALAGLLIDASTAIDTTGKTPRELAGENAILSARVEVLERELDQLAEQRDELVASLRIGAKWMEWWLTNEMCDCDGIGHICGKPQRQAELDSMQATLARVNQPAAVTANENAGEPGE